MTSKITYLGNLRTSSIHTQSGTEILSDAPIDNNGKGEAFSPTDLIANATGSCMMTIMAIKARDLNVDLIGTTIDVTKIMQSEPRKISRIEIIMNIPITTDEKTKTILERTAINCPVLLSLNPDIEKDITINWKK
ncbi:OsmC family protein [Flavobacterium psychrophilum]|uniref:OsmC family protein n=2 Tax=Flavobacterium psychrophilum TaxID=96345 RepID=UPI00073EE2AD|nr:OsmC family protein [Flavobacterium psychrophilum]EKT4502018.1 OsmC family protein [Flavobacterium psychrophilum]EKT4520664.1 OsmC family protein [Flavobacterium psychrophilum]ELI6455689.1 OsmC family protein [Flavobacterium psychrophilum]ELV7524773.1 OsmC family protein [Flavobacterium psychrophilum]ELY2017681.1 OsmC family protein [Flavobacterium psychrophilum]